MTFYKEVKTPRWSALSLLTACLHDCTSVWVWNCLWCVLQHPVVRTLCLAVTPFPPEIFPVASTAVVQTSDLGCTGMAQNNHKYLPNSHTHKLQKCDRYFKFKLLAGVWINSRAAVEWQYLTGTFPPHQVCIVSWNESQFPQYFFMSVCVCVCVIHRIPREEMPWMGIERGWLRFETTVNCSSLSKSN